MQEHYTKECGGCEDEDMFPHNPDCPSRPVDLTSFDGADLSEVLYIEACHVTGEHDPTHTPRHICTLQLSAIAERLLQKVYGQTWRSYVNDIPRRPDGWTTRHLKELEATPDIESWEAKQTDEHKRHRHYKAWRQSKLESLENARTEKRWLEVGYEHHA